MWNAPVMFFTSTDPWTKKPSVHALITTTNYFKVRPFLIRSRRIATCVHSGGFSNRAFFLKSLCGLIEIKRELIATIYLKTLMKAWVICDSVFLVVLAKCNLIRDPDLASRSTKTRLIASYFVNNKNLGKYCCWY